MPEAGGCPSASHHPCAGAREITSDSHKEPGGEAQTPRNKSAGGEAAAPLGLVKDETTQEFKRGWEENKEKKDSRKKRGEDSVLSCQVVPQSRYWCVAGEQAQRRSGRRRVTRAQAETSRGKGATSPVWQQRHRKGQGHRQDAPGAN